MSVGKIKTPKPKGYGKLSAPPPTSIDHNTLRIVFGFRHIVKGFDLSAGDGKVAGNFIDGLRMRCTMTWAELRRQNRERLGSEKISASIRVGIPQSVAPEKKEDLLCFRFGNLERFIGFQDGATFEIVWIDHSGECYDH